jgi:hypothetical protein
VVRGAVGVPTEVLGFQCVLVGDVVCSGGGDLVQLGPVGALGLEDSEGMCRVGRAP